jgi:APA family basic amino acid/polyamine antiporter
MSTGDLAAPTTDVAPRVAQPVRQKSGLVRTASAYQAFVFSLSGISVGIMISWGQFFGTSLYPGANTILAMAIATLGGLCVYWAYQYWGQVFPRSGGDYIFLSRTFNPGFGFGVNAVFVYIILASPALAMSILMPLLSSLAATLSDTTGWHFLSSFSTWLNGTWAFAIVGTIWLALCVLANWLGLKVTLRVLGTLWVIALGGTVVMIIALLASKNSTFVEHLRTLTGKDPDQIQKVATKNGFVDAGFSFSQTLKLTVWYTPSLFFAYIVVYIGGEIKNVRHSLRIAGLAAVAMSGLLAIVWVAALNHVVPSSLQGALAYNSSVAPDASTPGVAYPHELMRVLWGSHGGGLILTLIAYVCVLSWVLIWGPVTTGFVQRGILAWGLDGLTPRWVSYVDPRRHSPVGAILISFVMAESLMLAFAFSPSYRTIVFLAPLFALVSLSLLAGIVFPFVRRSLFEQSIVGNAKLLGLTAMSVFCAIGFSFLLWQAIYIWRDPIASGADHTKPVIICLATIVAGTLYYIGLRTYKRRRGEDITATFREIPIE